MSSATFTKKDLNRYSKAYPFTRKEPRHVFYSTETFAIENGIVSFAGSDTATYTFLNAYTTAPTVVATPLDDSFNVYIQSVSLTSVVIGASAPNNKTATVVVVLT